jgi:D-3-phosphoglycerate dehydrogenase
MRGQTVTRILNVEPANYSDSARRILQSLGELDERDLGRAELLDCVSGYDVLLVRLRSQIDREVIDAGTRLRAIVTATTGLDHVDTDYARQRGIAVLSLRGETEFLRTIPATAEHTWGLLLALMRRIPWAFQSVLDGQWDRDAFRGHDLGGKRLGIVGLGRLGRKVARYGAVFGMRVYAYDTSRGEGIENVTQCESLDELLRHSDVLTLHVPLNAETEGLVGFDECRLLPPGAVLINTSRGRIVDESALLHALESGRLAGAALDVIAAEQTPVITRQDELLAYADSHTNLLITPHIGGATEESMAATEVFMANKLGGFLEERV